jgi:hypothetical protein
MRTSQRTGVRNGSAALRVGAMSLREWTMRETGLLLCVLLGSGCATHGVRPLRPLEVPTAPYQDVIASSMTGTLMYEGGCLIFRDEATRVRLLPVWPTGSTFNGTSVFFHQPGKAEQRIVLGEEFLIEGRSLPWPAPLPTYFVPFQQQCAAKPFYVSAIRPAN